MRVRLVSRPPLVVAFPTRRRALLPSASSDRTPQARHRRTGSFSLSVGANTRARTDAGPPKRGAPAKPGNHGERTMRNRIQLAGLIALPALLAAAAALPLSFQSGS